MLELVDFNPINKNKRKAKYDDFSVVSFFIFSDKIYLCRSINNIKNVNTNYVNFR